MTAKESERMRGTHVLESADGETYQDVERKGVIEG